MIIRSKYTECISRKKIPLTLTFLPNVCLSLALWKMPSCCKAWILQVRGTLSSNIHPIGVSHCENSQLGDRTEKRTLVESPGLPSFLAREEKPLKTRLLERAHSQWKKWLNNSKEKAGSSSDVWTPCIGKHGIVRIMIDLRVWTQVRRNLAPPNRREFYGLFASINLSPFLRCTCKSIWLATIVDETRRANSPLNACFTHV